jgi:hypothetical protein
MKHHNDPAPDPEQAALERQVESLRRDIHQLQLEHDLLKKANELLKKDLGVDLRGCPEFCVNGAVGFKVLASSLQTG